MSLLSELLALHAEQVNEDQQLDVYGTVEKAMRGQLKSVGRQPDAPGQHVQVHELKRETGYTLSYVSIYNAEEGIAPVEAFVLLNTKTGDLSFYDHDSRDLYIDGKHVGTSNREDILNDYVQEYKLEGGPSYVVDGACEAYLETLKQM